MVRITFVSASGERTDLDLSEGVSVMRAATENGVQEIIGECGGSAMCAICTAK